jgi:hypothetical protein
MSPDARNLLSQEARALLTRLSLVKPLVLQETMVPAANVSDTASAGMERALGTGRRAVRALVRGFLGWLGGKGALRATDAQAQRRFSLVRMQFNLMLAQFDIFSDAYSQRSEHKVGVWLAGLDVAAADALALPGYYRSPPLVCYLDRGIGAAIRRARTRLPGGVPSPVAIVRVPRERMVGSGIASSLMHEVGHQAAALLDLVASLRQTLRGLGSSGTDADTWKLWDRWISEIVADFWSVARVGISSTMGLMGVVSLPPPFVFRVNLADPHPMPWIRVRLSCAIGAALYPHEQWERLAGLWRSLYPIDGLDAERRHLLGRMENNMPAFVEMLVGHRPRSLRGASLREALRVDERQPAELERLFRLTRGRPDRLRRLPPSLAFAVVGQARANGELGPEDEAAIVSRLLRQWALADTLRAAESCAAAQDTYRAGREFAPAT